MSRRIRHLSLLGIVFLLVMADQAAAHGFIAKYRVQPNQQVRVEGWFDSGDPASGAKVKVLRADKSVLAQGRMNDEGVFLFSFKEQEPLVIVVDAGQGHGEELTLSPETLAKPSTETGPIRPTPPTAVDTEPGATHTPTPFPIRDVILGITFLLALAAFVISLRNAQALRKPSSGM
jgi:hypothetical protein